MFDPRGRRDAQRVSCIGGGDDREAKSGNALRRGNTNPGFRYAHPGYTVIAGKLTMKRQNVMWMLLAPAIAVVVMFLAEPVRAEVLEQMKTVASTTVHYKIVLPDGYDPAKAYPAILAFGGGPQDMSSVDNILNSQLPCRG